MGVNEHRYVADGYPRVVSNASCRDQLPRAAG